MDHLEVRFGREVIFDWNELSSTTIIGKPQRLSVEALLPVAARPRGMSDSMLPRVAADTANDTDGFSRFERL